MGVRTVCCRCRRVLVSSNGRRLGDAVFDSSLVARKRELLAATGDNISDKGVMWAWCQGCWDAERASVKVSKEQVSKWLFTLAHGKQSEKAKAKIAGEVLYAFSELERERDNWKQAADWLRQALELKAETSGLRKRRAGKRGEGVSGVKVEDVAREVVQRQGKNWDELGELDRTVYRNIARAIMFLSSDVTEIEE